MDILFFFHNTVDKYELYEGIGLYSSSDTLKLNEPIFFQTEIVQDVPMYFDIHRPEVRGADLRGDVRKAVNKMQSDMGHV